MADTGFKVAGNVVSAGTWTGFTTTNINTSDNTRATSNNATYQPATINNLSFGIPSGATIDGIEAQAEFSSNAASTSSIRLSLSWNNGSTYTSTKSDSTTSTTDSVKTYGGAADTWGRSWTDTEFADGTFVVKIEGNCTTGGGNSCRLDYFAIKVYYTIASTNTAGFFIAFLGAQ